MSSESVQELNDERLMAYVDGRLSEAERASVEEALGIDHDFRAELEELSRAGHLVDDVLSSIMQEVQAADLRRQESAPAVGVAPQQGVDGVDDAGSPLPGGERARVPERPAPSVEPPVKEVVDLVPPATVPAEGDRQEAPAGVAMAEERAAPVRRGWRWLLGAAALLSSAYGGYLYSQVSLQAPSVPVAAAPLSEAPSFAYMGAVAQGSPLAFALESIHSRELYVASDGSGDIVLPVISFQAGDGRYCRQFEINSGPALYSGLACRGGEGWRLEMLLAGGVRTAEVAAYQPPSGRYKDAVSIVFEQLWDGGYLNRAEEEALIRRGWR